MPEVYENVKAKVSRIIYFNDKNKWGVLAIENPFKNDKNFTDITVPLAGNFDGVYANCYVEFSGSLAHHQQYGNQITISKIKVLQDTTTKEGIIDFLTKSKIRGISIQNAKKIYDAFGKQSISVVLNNPEKIMTIRGIADLTYEKVAESISEYTRMEGLINYGTSLGIPYTLIYLLDTTFGDKALDVLKNDIYSIIEKTDVISFKTIDGIALKTGVKPDDPKRLKACLIYCLKTRVMMNSSTGCQTNELRSDFNKLVGTDDISLYQSTLAQLIKDNIMVVEGAKVYYKRYYDKEEFIGRTIASLMKTPLTKKIDEETITKVISSFPFELNIQQRAAIRGILDTRVSVLTGLGGTGKSTITKALVDALRKAGRSYRLMTPTGKATRRLYECTGSPASTIHKFLGVTCSLEDAVPPVVPVDTFFIIDECSMLDILVLTKLMELAATTPIQIVFIGDEHQLPSVQAGNILADFIDSGIVPVFKLTDIMRQAKDSNIIKYCSDINNGKRIEPTILPDFAYSEYYDPNDLCEELQETYVSAVKQYGLHDVQVISAYKSGPLGTNSLNELLTAAVNKSPMDETFKYKVGDKVMQLVNNYKKDVFNGETGVVRSIEDSDYMYVDFGDKLCQYTKGDLNTIQLAYAATCHKSQGSEYSVVFVIVDNTQGNFLLTRRLLYTAVSRGKKKVYIMASPHCVPRCIANTHEVARVTKLDEFLRVYSKANLSPITTDWETIPF